MLLTIKQTIDFHIVCIQMLVGQRKFTHKRCAVCLKKVGVNYFECKCNPERHYCAQHRFPFEHHCSLDVKHLAQIQLCKQLGVNTTP